MSTPSAYPSLSIAHLRTMALPVSDHRIIPFGLSQLDSRLGGGGLRAGALHEATAVNPALVDGAAAMLFLAGIAAGEARLGGGPVLWVSCRNDLYAPGLEQAGLASADVIYAQPRDDAALLAVIEDAVRDGTPSVVVVEAGRMPMVASSTAVGSCPRFDLFTLKQRSLVGARNMSAQRKTNGFNKMGPNEGSHPLRQRLNKSRWLQGLAAAMPTPMPTLR